MSVKKIKNVKVVPSEQISEVLTEQIKNYGKMELGKPETKMAADTLKTIVEAKTNSEEGEIKYKHETRRNVLDVLNLIISFLGVVGGVASTWKQCRSNEKISEANINFNNRLIDAAVTTELKGPEHVALSNVYKSSVQKGIRFR